MDTGSYRCKDKVTLEWGGFLIQQNWCTYKKGKLCHRQAGEKPQDYGGRDEGHASTSRETLKIAKDLQKLGEHNRFSPFRRNQSCRLPTSNFCLPALGEINFCCESPRGVWHRVNAITGNQKPRLPLRTRPSQVEATQKGSARQPGVKILVALAVAVTKWLGWVRTACPTKKKPKSARDGRLCFWGGAEQN